MAKYEEEKVSENQFVDEYDVLEDIQPEDFVFVINGAGQLKGISFPETLTDTDEIDSTIEEIIAFLVEKHKEVRPPNATLH